MLQRNPLMLSCALGALMLSAGAAVAQTPPPPTNSQTAPATENTTDQAKRAKETKQNTDAASASAIETVTVTAEHRADSLQKLPIAASVYTDERRNLVGIETASDIINFTPSASLNGEFLAIRGVSRVNTSAFGSDSGVAVLVDGIYTPSPDYLGQPDFFSDRIEVLRGPQGTLGGQNDIGGSVNVVEKRPTSDFHEEFRYSINNYFNQTADASISGPITDNLRFRVADSLNWAPSWAGPEKNLDSNTYPGSGLGNLFEGQLDWTPISNLDVWVKIQNNANDYKAYYGVSPDQYPLYPPNPYLGYANCPTINGAVLQCLVPFPQDLQSPTSNPQIHNPFAVNVNTTGYTKLRNDWTYTTQVNWQLNGATVEYIGGYSQYNYLSEYDADDTSSSSLQNAGGIFPTGFLAQTQVADQAEQWYQNEIDVKSDNDSAFKWLVGVFQYRNHYRAPFAYEEPNNPTLANVSPANPSRAYYSQVAELTDKSEAVYGNLDYDLTDTVRLTGGLRYNWDDKAGNLSYREIFDVAGVFYCPTCAPTD